MQMNWSLRKPFAGIDQLYYILVQFSFLSSRRTDFVKTFYAHLCVKLDQNEEKSTILHTFYSKLRLNGAL